MFLSAIVDESNNVQEASVPLSEDEKNHLIRLVRGEIKPATGLEMHFMKFVIKNPDRVSTPEESEWLHFINDSKIKNRGNSFPPSKAVVNKVGGKETRIRIAREKAHTRLAKKEARIHAAKERSRIRAAKRIKSISVKEMQEREKPAYCPNSASKPQEEIKTTSSASKYYKELRTKVQANAEKFEPRYVDEGIAGTREDNKRNRGRQRFDSK